MGRYRNHWDFGDFLGRGSSGSGPWGPNWKGWAGSAGRRWRTQIFEAGEMKFVILRLLQEKPRHGYEIIKALEEKMWGCYTPSAGAVYPTLQLLEDQGYVRVVETEGKKVYHVTRDGERFLAEHQSTLDDIFDRLRETVRDYAGGAMGDLNKAFSRVAKVTYKNARRWGPGHPATKRVAEILETAASDIERAWNTSDRG
jgi:DNA-binding PadR family transcriptional regulator